MEDIERNNKHSSGALWFIGISWANARVRRACQYRHISQDINKFLEEAAAARDVVERCGRVSSSDVRAKRIKEGDARGAEVVLVALAHVANEPVNVFDAREVVDLVRL